MSWFAVRPFIKAPVPSFLAVKEVPAYCTRLAVVLDRQPFFTGTYEKVERCKVVSMKYDETLHTFHWINAIARNALGNRGWPLYRVGASCNMRDANGILVEGATLWVEKKEKLCSIMELDQTYHEVIAKMQRGWVESKPQEYSDLGCRRNEDEFALFVKSDTSDAEQALIRTLAQKFNLSDELVFSDQSSSYIWVRRSSLSKIEEKLGLKFDR